MKRPSRRKAIASNARRFFNDDRSFRASTFVVVVLLISILVLGVAILRILAERDSLYSQRDALPLRDLAQLQRQVLLLKNAVAGEPPSLYAEEVSLNMQLVQSRVAILRNARLKELLPAELYTAIQQSDGTWSAISVELANWSMSPQDRAEQTRLANELGELEISLNESLARVNIFGLELNNEARESNSQLILATAAISAPIVLTVVLVALIFTRFSRNQMQAAIDQESIRKYPEQSPFPTMRVAPDYSLIYSNPASKQLAGLLGVKEGRITRKLYRNWLDRAFKGTATDHIEGKSGDRVFSLISSPIPQEGLVNIYGFDITDLKDAELKVRRQLMRLNALHIIDKAIAGDPDLDRTLSILLDQVRANLGVDATAIFITRPDDVRLYSAAFSGFHTKEIANFSLMPGESLAGRVAAKRQVVSIPDLIKSGIPVAPELNNIEGFKSYFASPLEVRGELLGVLETFNRHKFEPDDEWLEFLRTLAGQAAIALDNAQLFRGLRERNTELRQAYDTTLEGWAKALELRDKETEGHSRRVTELTMLLAFEVGIPTEKLDDVRRGAILHDIGKMGVPDEILLKPGALTENEWVVMKRHTQYAYDLLSPIAFLQSALDIPYAHHEKWDGSGYPRGLKGKAIPLAARVFAVVDVWDALRSDRPYRPAWSKEKTVAYLEENSGTHFDPKVVEVFLKLVKSGKIN